MSNNLLTTKYVVPITSKNTFSMNRKSVSLSWVFYSRILLPYNIVLQK